jgi:hypothetical protein
MTEQPVETEQQFLGNDLKVDPLYPSAAALLDCTGGYACTATSHLEGCLLGSSQQKPLQHYAPNAHRGRFSPLRDKAKRDIQTAFKERAILDELAAASLPVEDLTTSPKTDLLLEAEVHTTHALAMLQNNELDAGIAWLQSALAMALNQRHTEQFGGARP